MSSDDLQDELEVLAEIYEGLEITGQPGSTEVRWSSNCAISLVPRAAYAYSFYTYIIFYLNRQVVKVQLTVQPSEVETGQSQFVQVSMALVCSTLYPSESPAIFLSSQC